MRPQVLALLLLSLAACVVQALDGRTLASAGEGVAVVPAQLGMWTGTPLPVDRRTIEILETSDVLATEYRRQDDSQSVWFAQVAGFGNRAAFHPPELCYVGSHFEVLERGLLTVSVHGRPRRVMRLVIGQAGKRFETWYWFTANGRMTPNYYQQQLWLLGATIRGQRPAGTLVRISTPLNEPSRSRERLLAFLTELVDHTNQ